MSFKIVSLLVIGVCVAILAWWSPEQNATRQPTTHLTENDLYLENFELEAYSANGKISHITQGKTLTRASGSGEYSIDTPLIQLTDDSGALWLLEANQGVMDAKMEAAQLKGAVNLSNSDGEGVHLKTPEMEINTLTQIVESQSGVTITQGTHTISSENLLADLKAGTLELTERVRGNYVPR